jgi:hypothetical protein
MMTRKDQCHSHSRRISRFLKLSKFTSIVQQHSSLTAIVQRPHLDNPPHHHEAHYCPLRPRARHHRPRSPVRRRPRDPICLHRQERKLPPESRQCPRKRRRQHPGHRRRLQYALPPILSSHTPFSTPTNAPRTANLPTDYRSQLSAIAPNGAIKCYLYGYVTGLVWWQKSMLT